MSLFPDVLPAHPASPEEVFYERRKLKYGLVGRIILALEMARERRQLARLDDHQLRDIGLGHEVSRWNVPTNWRTDINNCFSRPGLL